MDRSIREILAVLADGVGSEPEKIEVGLRELGLSAFEIFKWRHVVSLGIGRSVLSEYRVRLHPLLKNHVVALIGPQRHELVIDFEFIEELAEIARLADDGDAVDPQVLARASSFSAEVRALGRLVASGESAVGALFSLPVLCAPHELEDEFRT